MDICESRVAFATEYCFLLFPYHYLAILHGKLYEQRSSVSISIPLELNLGKICHLSSKLSFYNVQLKLKK